MIRFDVVLPALAPGRLATLPLPIELGMMAAMAAVGGLVMWFSRKRLAQHHPHSTASGG